MTIHSPPSPSVHRAVVDRASAVYTTELFLVGKTLYALPCCATRLRHLGIAPINGTTRAPRLAPQRLQISNSPGPRRNARGIGLEGGEELKAIERKEETQTFPPARRGGGEREERYHQICHLPSPIGALGICV
jgi:hypothetical protein